MKSTDIFRELGGIDPNVIESSAPGKSIKSRSLNAFVRWGSFAACLALILTACILIIPEASAPADPNEPVYVRYDELTAGREYKNYRSTTLDGIRTYMWDKRTPEEKCPKFSINGSTYSSRGRMIDEKLLGGVIGTGTGIGYCDYESAVKYTKSLEARCIKGVDEEYMIAVDLEGIYYVYMLAAENDSTSRYETFGDLIDTFDLTSNVIFSHFSEKGNAYAAKHHTVNNSNEIWRLLKKLKDGKCTHFDSTERITDDYYLSFTISSEALGFYNKSIYISQNGYVWTNAFDISYAFDIGKNAAKKLINYALENSSDTEYAEDECRFIAKIVEIGEDYCIVDDSICCLDEDEGIRYRVSLNDPKLKRDVEERCEVGSTVWITFSGKIDSENANTLIEITEFIECSFSIIAPTTSK